MPSRDRNPGRGEQPQAYRQVGTELGGAGVMTSGQSRNKMKKSLLEKNATKSPSNTQAISGLNSGEGTQGSVPGIGASRATPWEELEYGIRVCRSQSFCASVISLFPFCFAIASS